MEVSKEHKKELLKLVHQTLEYYLKTNKFPQFKTNDPELMVPCGVFVTLFEQRQLRGCIGHTQADMPMYVAVQEMAISAATIDPRFPPVSKHELSDIHVEISVLSELFPITIDQVEVGKHGLMLVYGGRRGLLLPRVPVERGWDVQTYLDNLCYKAGLPMDIWDYNPTLYAFTACEFSENDEELADCA
jgi:AmmeMemoRadiSam system protein A